MVGGEGRDPSFGEDPVARPRRRGGRDPVAGAPVGQRQGLALLVAGAEAGPPFRLLEEDQREDKVGAAGSVLGLFGGGQFEVDPELPAAGLVGLDRDRLVVTVDQLVRAPEVVAAGGGVPSAGCLRLLAIGAVRLGGATAVARQQRRDRPPDPAQPLRTRLHPLEILTLNRTV